MPRRCRSRRRSSLIARSTPSGIAGEDPSRTRPQTERPSRRRSRHGPIKPRSAVAIGPAIQPEPGLLPTVAGHSDLNSPPTAATNPGPRLSSAEHATALLTPDDGTDETEAAVPFVFDLGPEPSLSEGLSRPKSRSASDFSASAAGDSAPARWPAHLQLWGLVAAGCDGHGPGRDPGDTRPAQRSRRGGRNGPLLEPRRRNPAEFLSKRPIHDRSARADPQGRTAIVVRFEDGEEVPAEQPGRSDESSHGDQRLGRAAKTRAVAPGRRSNPPFGSGRGRLNIRAAPGVTPVIEVAMGGPQPFLQTGSAVLLELSGLTFVVRYPKPRGIPLSRPAALDRGRRQDNQDRPLRLQSRGQSSPQGLAARSSPTAARWRSIVAGSRGSTGPSRSMPSIGSPRGSSRR